MKALILCVFASCALVASGEGDPESQRIYGGRINLQPSRGGYIPPVGHGCKPTVIYGTKAIYSTVVVPSTVFNNDVRYQTQTSVQVQQVFSTFYSNIVSTQVVPRTQFQTQTITRTQGNPQTSFVTLPGGVNVVTQTRFTSRTQVQFQTQFITRDTRVPSTFTQNVVSTQIVPQQVFSTIFRTQTITRTQTRPGQTQTIDSTLYSTVLSTIVVPGQNVVRTLFVTRTNFQTQTVTQPGQTQVITSTNVNPITSTFFSTIAVTNTQTRYITRTQFTQQFTTQFQTNQGAQTNTRTVTVPSQVINTRYSTQIIPSTIIKAKTIPTVIHVPGQTRVQTIFRTYIRTQQLPGLTRTVYQTRTIFNTNFHTSTVYNKHYITITDTKVIKPYCKTHAYGYAKPAPTYSPYGPH